MLDEFMVCSSLIVELIRCHRPVPPESQLPTVPTVPVIPVPIDGPPPYNGDIVTIPDAVWAEDIWTEGRIELARERINQQGPSLSSYYRNLYTGKADRYWHDFYRRNQDHFYKDRHYLHRIFPELDYDAVSPRRMQLLEVGCGVGNASLPLLEINPELHIIAVDFAPSAIELLSTHPLSLANKHRFIAAVCDITRDELPVPDESVDLVLCFFVLSAIAPELQQEAVDKIYAKLRPGGRVLFRDYGRYDEAQLRFGRGKKLGDNMYVRQDGTIAYYFELEELRALFSGLVERRCEYVLRQQANRKLQQGRYRVWTEAIFEKPSVVEMTS